MYTWEPMCKNMQNYQKSPLNFKRPKNEKPPMDNLLFLIFTSHFISTFRKNLPWDWALKFFLIDLKITVRCVVEWVAWYLSIIHTFSRYWKLVFWVSLNAHSVLPDSKHFLYIFKKDVRYWIGSIFFPFIKIWKCFRFRP